MLGINEECSGSGPWVSILKGSMGRVVQGFAGAGGVRLGLQGSEEGVERVGG